MPMFARCRPMFLRTTSMFLQTCPLRVLLSSRCLHIFEWSECKQHLGSLPLHPPLSTQPAGSASCNGLGGRRVRPKSYKFIDLPAELAERLLFGARRGAYSGAVSDAKGLSQSTHGGTLFLDEIA